MIVFGITGGTGAGKTSALRVLAELGAYLIDCDALYYEMLRPGTALHEDIGTAFGRDNLVCNDHDGLFLVNQSADDI